ncbi:MAG: DNA pilot protein [Microviridae sp.]|nr:MAG: DNA pilot protein [Microviridae sp.]
MLGTNYPISGAGSGFNYGPATLGLAGAGLALQGLGTVLGSANSKKNIHWQREQLQKGIQYRVADAKAAGIHPLYALGAQIQSPSPIQVDGGVGQGLQSMGQGLGQFSQRFQTGWERQLTQMQLQVLASEARKNTAMASFYTSQAVGNSPGYNPQSNQATIDQHGNIIPGQADGTGVGKVELKPDPKISTIPGSSNSGAAINPLYSRFTTDEGIQVPMAYSNQGPAESLEGWGAALIPGAILRDAKKYGPLASEYAVDALGSLLWGRTPRVNWSSMLQHMDRFERRPGRFEQMFQKLKQGTWDRMHSAWKGYDERNRKLWSDLQRDYYPPGPPRKGRNY